jgi:mRNA interferase MazF
MPDEFKLGSPDPKADQKPPRVAPRIVAAPKLRQVYWCDFWRDALLPETWKRRPVIVMSYKNTLHGPCLVIPTTTQTQGGNPWAFQLSGTVDDRFSWAICNHPYTVSTSRLFQVRGRIPSASKAEFNEILRRLNAWLPRPFDLET